MSGVACEDRVRMIPIPMPIEALEQGPVGVERERQVDDPVVTRLETG